MKRVKQEAGATKSSKKAKNQTASGADAIPAEVLDEVHFVMFRQWMQLSFYHFSWLWAVSFKLASRTETVDAHGGIANYLDTVFKSKVGSSFSKIHSQLEVQWWFLWCRKRIELFWWDNFTLNCGFFHSVYYGGWKGAKNHYIRHNQFVSTCWNCFWCRMTSCSSWSGWTAQCHRRCQCHTLSQSVKKNANHKSSELCMCTRVCNMNQSGIMLPTRPCGARAACVCECGCVLGTSPAGWKGWWSLWLGFNHVMPFRILCFPNLSEDNFYLRIPTYSFACLSFCTAIPRTLTFLEQRKLWSVLFGRSWAWTRASALMALSLTHRILLFFPFRPCSWPRDGQGPLRPLPFCWLAIREMRFGRQGLKLAIEKCARVEDSNFKFCWFMYNLWSGYILWSVCHG